MKDSPVSLAALAVVIVVAFAGLSAFVKSRSQPIYIASPKVIAADPDFWFEKSIQLKTSSMEVFLDEQGAKELRYRELTNRPFCVIVRGKIPDPAPDSLLVFCEGTKDGVTVLICR